MKFTTRTEYAFRRIHQLFSRVNERTTIRYSVGHKEAVEWGQDILTSNVVEMVGVGRELFEPAWELFKTYEDKKLSFTDCTSFAIMMIRCIEKVFSFDDDFERVGFKLLP